MAWTLDGSEPAKFGQHELIGVLLALHPENERILRFDMPFLNPLFILSILVAISIHECAHAFVADRLGDPTPRNAGRLTLNPLAHLDWMGALLFLVVGFGWATPVPIDSRYFKHPNRDITLVALAGPASNFLLALLCYVALALLTGQQQLSFGDLLDGSLLHGQAAAFFLAFLRSSIFVNLGLMAFNLLPIAPLDGSNILRIFWPLRYEDLYHEYLRIGPFMLFGLIVLEAFLPITILSAWVHILMNAALWAFSLLPI